MEKKEHIWRYSADEVDKAAAQSQTDWTRVNAKTAAEIEADAVSDDAGDGMVVDWTQGEIGLPLPKAVLNMRIDRDVLEYFKTGGKGYQTKINAVLRAYKDAHASKHSVNSTEPR